ncbi:hypothetical protein QTP86_010381 [Hemibagrus guttatus]|nr:hypothetical protein QTP86_010381 [Hemibagrus guttatus]
MIGVWLMVVLVVEEGVCQKACYGISKLSILYESVFLEILPCYGCGSGFQESRHPSLASHGFLRFARLFSLKTWDKSHGWIKHTGGREALMICAVRKIRQAEAELEQQRACVREVVAAATLEVPRVDLRNHMDSLYNLSILCLLCTLAAHLFSSLFEYTSCSGSGQQVL